MLDGAMAVGGGEGAVRNQHDGEVAVGVEVNAACTLTPVLSHAEKTRGRGQPA
jgi:hypothetical protein